ncbi:response regulator [Bradyrhizobium sp. dw_78]|uniref:response regulator n=1 Tax=Bradyrhizobium sp. dw_78 TaxID=2719793 RepID=UPI001BD314F2|nr:response regulator [Bradyrhizobium sp. dw_78]
MYTRFEPTHSTDTSRIYVVEGDEVVRSALQFILDSHGETRGFASLDPAFADPADLAPDIVLLGIGLLENGGERILIEIARHWPGTKILIVANSVNDQLARSSLKWGAHDVLGRPITFDGVRGKVDALLEDHAISPTLIALLPLSAAW